MFVFVKESEDCKRFIWFVDIGYGLSINSFWIKCFGFCEISCVFNIGIDFIVVFFVFFF